MVDYHYPMVELPDNTPVMKCIWNKHKNIPDTFKHTITIEIETSVDIDSIKQWLSDTISGTLQSISTQTRAKEELISIETTKF